MMIYENNIFFNNKKIISEEKKRKKVLIFLDDGTILKKGDINNKEIEIECSECHKKIKLKFYNGLLKRKYLCQRCNHLGEKNAMYGKKHSKEMKDKLSKERKGIWGVGEKNAMYGKDWRIGKTKEELELHRKKSSEYWYKWSDEQKREKIEKGKKTFANRSDEEKKKSKEKLLNTISKRSQEEREKISKKISDAQKRYKEKNPEEYRKAKQKAAHASRLSQGNYKKTKIEEKVEEWLKNNNINYDYSCIIGSGENCFQYDFIIHGKRILIEVQGDYWHGNPDLFNDDGTDGKRMLNEIQIKKKEIDIIKKKFAENKKFKVLYIWENEINNNNFKSLEEILKND